jgi:MurNAc alpha-1-phosphate uridylyltransferase
LVGASGDAGIACGSGDFMRAFILAAGEGRRMLPLTTTTPKPLLVVRGKALIEWHLEALAKAGITQVVINLHYLGDQIRAHLGNGAAFGIDIVYSDEPSLLETGGGIKQALPLLDPDRCDAPFVVVNGDIFTDFDFAQLPSELGCWQARLVMVSNPPHHPEGDYGIDRDGSLQLNGPRWTYSGIGVYSPRLFEHSPQGSLMLRDLFGPAIQSGTLAGQVYQGQWADVGTPAGLAALNG